MKLNIRPTISPVVKQTCPSCNEIFPANDGGKHLKGCKAYQERQSELTADYEDEDGVWWTYNQDTAEWKRK